MVLVDTSVWVDFFTGTHNPQVAKLVSLIEDGQDIAFTGVVLQEIMQGCKDDASAKLIESRFAAFVEVFPERSTYVRAAKIFRDARCRGYTIRSQIDCLIAACAMEAGCAVLHRDRDFDVIKKVCALSVLRN